MEEFPQEQEEGKVKDSNLLLVPESENYIKGLEDYDEGIRLLDALESEIDAPAQEPELHHFEGNDYTVRTLSTGHSVVFRPLTPEETQERVQEGRISDDKAYLVLGFKDPGETWSFGSTPESPVE
jgi:hypothetical protein